MFATPSFVFEMLELLLEKNINIEELELKIIFSIVKKEQI
jgi:hypothetical protein